jgi:hypothetical protein
MARRDDGDDTIKEDSVSVQLPASGSNSRGGGSSGRDGSARRGKPNVPATVEEADEGPTAIVPSGVVRTDSLRVPMGTSGAVWRMPDDSAARPLGTSAASLPRIGGVSVNGVARAYRAVANIQQTPDNSGA